MVEPGMREALAICWREVSNAGGAVGFPFLAISADQVRTAVVEFVESLNPRSNRLLLVNVGGDFAGWLLLAGNSGPLTAHWARVLRAQTALSHRATGVGRVLMGEVARAARDDFGLDRLHPELRADLGLEGFDDSLGWREIGRWPSALRLGDDDRDEVLMFLPLR